MFQQHVLVSPDMSTGTNRSPTFHATEEKRDIDALAATSAIRHVLPKKNAIILAKPAIKNG
jgi:hypothetical protein